MLTEEEIWTAIRQSSIRAPVTRDDMVRVAKWARDQMMPTWWKPDVAPTTLGAADRWIYSYNTGLVEETNEDGTYPDEGWCVMVASYYEQQHIPYPWREAIPGIDWPLEGESDDHD